MTFDSDLRPIKQPEFDDVVFLLSPDRPMPKPKKWNIQPLKVESSD